MVLAVSASTTTLELSPRSDGARYRRVSLALEDGELVLAYHDLGASLEAAWGVDDEEITIRIERNQLARLAVALVAERLVAGNDPVRRLADLCDEHGVDYRAACWT
jgi:hypothetical protein